MKKKEKKIMLIASIMMFVVVLFIFALTLMHYWPYWFGLEKWDLYASVNVSSERSGFDLNGTALTFGLIKLSGSATRNIIVNNSHNFPIFVEITSEGNITSLLIYENNVKVEMGESKKIGFSAVSDENTTLGYYDGFVHFKTVPAV